VRALRSPTAWTGGAGGTKSSIALVEQPRVRATKAALDDEVGANMIAQVEDTEGQVCLTGTMRQWHQACNVILD
jgi:hypothetical protein